MDEPYAPIYTVFTYKIVPKEVASKMGNDFGQKPVGTGPYQFVNYKTDEKLELKAFENYFGQKAKTEKLTIKIIKDDTVRVMALLKGTVDIVINGVPVELLSRVENEDDLRILTADGLIFYYLNLDRS